MIIIDVDLCETSNVITSKDLTLAEGKCYLSRTLDENEEKLIFENIDNSYNNEAFNINQDIDINCDGSAKNTRNRRQRKNKRCDELNNDTDGRYRKATPRNFYFKRKFKK